MTIEFDPTDPFPLVKDPDAHYAAAREHARAADRWLGLAVERVEAALPRERLAGSDQELWLDLGPDALLTPYVELRALMARLAPQPGSVVVDLGAGYGRLGFVIGRHHPQVEFTGYEIVPERVEAGRAALARLAYPGVQLERADLADHSFAPRAADVYFLYDYGTRAAIEKTLRDLRSIARARPLVLVGRGRACRDAVERRHPWLSQVVPPEHSDHASIYRTRAPWTSRSGS